MNEALAQRVMYVRSFNRFYTNVIGVLRGHLLQTPFTLTEARVLFELAHRAAAEVVELRRELDVDAGHLSRVLTRLGDQGLLTRARSASDGRRQTVRLTAAGRRAFATLDRRSSKQIEQLLEPLADEQQRRLVAAMRTIHDALQPPERPEMYLIREPEPGELGWVVQRHGALYAQEYGWDDTFEALVARIVADYVEHREPRCDRVWIAEADGAPVGCVFCVKKDDRTAQLRLLLVEPTARGLGIGARLVAECIRFARRAGYSQLVLWTNDVLASARRIYEAAGFVLDQEEPHHSFGHDLVGQFWSLRLR
jgi:DNA-binding MarR family transcriptional regulator/GNAT superfamily N-acetyltransferase